MAGGRRVSIGVQEYLSRMGIQSISQHHRFGVSLIHVPLPGADFMQPFPEFLRNAAYSMKKLEHHLHERFDGKEPGPLGIAQLSARLSCSSKPDDAPGVPRDIPGQAEKPHRFSRHEEGSPLPLPHRYPPNMASSRFLIFAATLQPARMAMISESPPGLRSRSVQAMRREGRESLLPGFTER